MTYQILDNRKYKQTEEPVTEKEEVSPLVLIKEKLLTARWQNKHPISGVLTLEERAMLPQRDQDRIKQAEEKRARRRMR